MPPMFDNNRFIRKFSIYAQQRFTYHLQSSHLQYAAILPCEIYNTKMLHNFHAECDN